MNTPGTRVWVGVGVLVRVAVGSVPVMVGVRVGVAVMVMVPVVVGVREGVGVSVMSWLATMGKYALVCIDALAMMIAPAPSKQASKILISSETWLDNARLIDL